MQEGAVLAVEQGVTIVADPRRSGRGRGAAARSISNTFALPPLPHHFRPIMDVNEATQDLIAGAYVGRCIFKHDWPENKM